MTASVHLALTQHCHCGAGLQYYEGPSPQPTCRPLQSSTAVLPSEVCGCPCKKYREKMQDHIEVAKHCGRNEILRCADSIFGSKYGPAKWCRFGSKSRASDRKNFAAARRCSTPQRRVSACCQDMDCATQTSSQLNPNVITTLLSLRLNAKPIALIVSSHYGTATKITKKGRTQTHTRPYTQVRAATQHHPETRDPPARIPEITWRNCNPMSAAWNQPTNDPKTFSKNSLAHLSQVTAKQLQQELFFPSNAGLSSGRLSGRKDNCILQIHRIKAVAMCRSNFRMIPEGNPPLWHFLITFPLLVVTVVLVLQLVRGTLVSPPSRYKPETARNEPNRTTQASNS